MSQWTFLTNHALLAIAEKPRSTITNSIWLLSR
jgi:hypothetical protein